MINLKPLKTYLAHRIKSIKKMIIDVNQWIKKCDEIFKNGKNNE